MNQSNKKSSFLIRSSKNRAFGTGFCVHIDEKGSYLLTAHHVIQYLSQNPNYEKVVESCKKVTEINPKNHSAYISMGFAYHNLRDFEGAIKSYKKGLKLSKNYSLFSFVVFLDLFQLQLIQNQKFDRDVSMEKLLCSFWAR